MGISGRFNYQQNNREYSFGNRNDNANQLFVEFKERDYPVEVNVRDQAVRVVIKNATYGIKEDGSGDFLDKISLQNIAEGIAQQYKNFPAKYIPFPKEIIVNSKISYISPEDSKQESDDKVTSAVIPIKPHIQFEQVYIDSDAKQQILAALVILKHHDLIYEDWGLKKNNPNNRAVILNFYGPPGTGKSMMAEAIANYLGKELYVVNYAELESKYMGETPKNIRNVFKQASANNSVILFDEADSFLGKRLTTVNQSADYGVNITRSVMLMEIERFQGVIIFTTNLIGNYDTAFKRRILSSVEFKLPDRSGRKIIWSNNLPPELPIDKGINADMLADRYPNISGADIKDIVLYSAIISLQQNRRVLQAGDFDLAFQYIRKRYETNDSQLLTRNISEQEFIEATGRKE